MKLLRNKKGSIFIGMLLVISVIIPFFIFTYEAAILHSTKNRIQGISENITSSAILMIDENETMEYGILSIDIESARYVADKIFDESFSSVDNNSPYFNRPVMNFTAENKSDGSVEVSVGIEMRLNKGFVFFKDIKIVSKSFSRGYSVDDLSLLKESGELDLMPWIDVYRMLRFETR